MTPNLLAARLHIVTGKGGTGKTTTAAALALALAGQGRRVLLCEIEGRQGIASVFDVAPLPYGERRTPGRPRSSNVSWRSEPLSGSHAYAWSTPVWFVTTTPRSAFAAAGNAGSSCTVLVVVLTGEPHGPVATAW